MMAQNLLGETTMDNSTRNYNIQKRESVELLMDDGQQADVVSCSADRVHHQQEKYYDDDEPPPCCGLVDHLLAQEEEDDEDTTDDDTTDESRHLTKCSFKMHNSNSVAAIVPPSDVVAMLSTNAANTHTNNEHSENGLYMDHSSQASGEPLLMSTSSSDTTSGHIHFNSNPATTTTTTTTHSTIRIGSSCISVNSVLSQQSNDSSLLEYPANTPICKFCHQRAKANNPLISPCHCKGTIRYMHARCLLKWLDKLKRRNSRSQPLTCEICNYEYRWRKQFKAPLEWQLPPCVGNDRQWHLIFVICALLMVISMVNLVIFGEDDHHHHHHQQHSHNHQPNTANYNYIHHRHSHQQNDPLMANMSTKFADPSSVLDISEDDSINSSPVFLLPALNASTLATFLRNMSSQLDQVASSPPNKTTNHNNNSSWNTIKKNPKKKTYRGSSEKKSISWSTSPNTNTNANTNTNTITNTNTNANSSSSFNSFQLSYDPWQISRRKSYQPTKPHEVILVISGCLFFISFFLGTFAQIKSEISFYNMLMRFIQWNQQWIIEEYSDEQSSSSHQATAGQHDQEEKNKPMIVDI